ncbi:hypothetical protein Pfo_014894 [Paulownia fortunei]|nr:hypothetical protein Pfo_014894 [Paulownia fortunei]
MFPSQHSDELLFQEPSILQQDWIVDHAFAESSNLVTRSAKKRQRISKSGFQESKDEETNGCKLRKIMHREIERQRRQEMATLYASLRSLLPLEYIRGKRSISDHMHEAVNYIKQMERNIKEFRMRRDKLKTMSNSAGSKNGSSNSFNLPNVVTVSSCRYGVEISISCGIEEGDGFPLSRVLMELLGTGLNIVSCISTKTNERFVYRIQSEVNDLAYINLSELQQRLANVINFG